MKTNKLSFLLAIVLIFTISAHGQYVTPGNNSSFTLTDLVNVSTGVVTGGDGHFLISNALTISATDTLKILTDDTVLVSATMRITVEGVLICNPPNLAVLEHKTQLHHLMGSGLMILTIRYCKTHQLSLLEGIGL